MIGPTPMIDLSAIGIEDLQSISSETLLDAVIGIIGFSLLAAGTGAIAAIAFRWYSDDEIPDGVAILLGISPVALLMNTQAALRDAVLGQSEMLEPEAAVITIAALVASGIAADAGRRTGDYLAREMFLVTAPRTINDVGQLLRSAGRVVSVELPEEIEDVDGYDPVDEATKAELAGETFLFPRRLPADQLRERLIDRLERDHGIGYVEVELTSKKTVEYLAVGSRPAGIGPTLAPGTVAVAVSGDPAPDASPGDTVRIWGRDGGDGKGDSGDENNGTSGPMRRLAEGELRATAGDVATVAVDADDAAALEPGADYRLVTRPDTPGTERELVSLLRTANDTVTTLPIDADSGLAGEAVGSLPVLVVALERAGDGDPVALPAADVRLEAGDTAYVLGRPDALRRIAETERTDGGDGDGDDGRDEQGRSRERERERDRTAEPTRDPTRSD
ncbi:TrkA C-terminal domain-containing protein [Halopiger xanaduensis]|uniref:TrkA-C domain protein n=1 Tax=Halopiger xanaduensis (strain DSM 18323 / JCM 14033 / SH-6) TaxID=797210 RepID=F8D442_HALXS|nr:TrkA C-terminal domain-containing protein [Halopiger xanaduensis]AEH36304.1 TrkA-C domain protein [Halopiger xanaduensis SH-6]